MDTITPLEEAMQHATAREVAEAIFNIFSHADCTRIAKALLLAPHELKDDAP